ncbi:MAG: hypothetical protein ABIT38_23560, partial [Gemmatimonadaceae bacterium]
MVVVAAGRAWSQEHTHAASGEQLGAVHFTTTCVPGVATQFNKGIALLHSFEFGAAISSFQDVLKQDSTCAMAQWGIALSRWTNPMAPGARPAAALENGRAAARAASQLAEHASARERAYIDAVNRLYLDYEHTSHRNRVNDYEQAMATVASTYPADTEATIFHALALVAAAPPNDKSYANQRAAGTTLERLWAKWP